MWRMMNATKAHRPGANPEALDPHDVLVEMERAPHVDLHQRDGREERRERRPHPEAVAEPVEGRSERV